jgi:hypothetical protein
MIINEFKIELIYNTIFDVECHIDNALFLKSKNKFQHLFKIKKNNIKVEFFINPQKIKPLIRINGFLVNYGLAKITPWDHKIEMFLDQYFYENYSKNIIESKKKYLGILDECSSKFDNFIGYNSYHFDIVNTIKKEIQ